MFEADSGKHEMLRGLQELHTMRIAALEERKGPLVALPTQYPDGYFVPMHKHSRAQLLCAEHGVVLVRTHGGRWMVPSNHAMWIPPGIEHSVKAIGSVHMRSIYVDTDKIASMPNFAHVVGLSDLMKWLIVDATSEEKQVEPCSRDALVLELILHDLTKLAQKPLGLPFPHDAKLEKLCRNFLENPTPHAIIDEWAAKMAMSRRSFTRYFLRQTGVSFSMWRQQACLFSALPRLADGESVTSVALDLGYESVAAFTTMFKRMLGVAPRAYLQGQGIQKL